jgi:hypothetical protein
MMKRPGPVVLAVISLLALLVVAVVGGLIFRGKYETTQTATRTFELEQNFTVVRKILVRKDGAKQIVTMGGGSEFLSQTWNRSDFNVESLTPLDPKWDADLVGTLRVRTQDDYVGEQDIALAQTVAIDPNSLHSEVKLKEPAERLRDYQMTTDFRRDQADKGTRIELMLSQTILTDAPWFAHGIADRRVLASVERTLANQEAAIRKLVQENLDDVPLFPLR